MTITFIHWQCLHSMQSRVCASVGRPSVPSGCHMPLLQVCCCEPTRQEISIDCFTVGGLAVSSGRTQAVQCCQLMKEAECRLVVKLTYFSRAS